MSLVLKSLLQPQPPPHIPTTSARLLGLRFLTEWRHENAKCGLLKDVGRPWAEPTTPSVPCTLPAPQPVHVTFRGSRKGSDAGSCGSSSSEPSPCMQPCRPPALADSLAEGQEARQPRVLGTSPGHLGIRSVCSAESLSDTFSLFQAPFLNQIYLISSLFWQR